MPKSILPGQSPNEPFRSHSRPANERKCFSTPAHCVDKFRKPAISLLQVLVQPRPLPAERGTGQSPGETFRKKDGLAATFYAVSSFPRKKPK